MKFDRIQCLVKITQDGDPNKLEVSLAGPAAISAAEIPVLRAINEIDGGGESACCVSNAKILDEVETTNKSEFERLCGKYGVKIMQALYPGGRGLAKTLADCELPDGALAPKPVKTAAKT